MSERHPSRPALVLRVPSRTEFLAAIRDTTRLLAELAGFEAAAAEQVALAVDEAATNVIRHAHLVQPEIQISRNVTNNYGVGAACRLFIALQMVWFSFSVARTVLILSVTARLFLSRSRL